MLVGIVGLTLASELFGLRLLGGLIDCVLWFNNVVFEFIRFIVIRLLGDLFV